MAPREKESGVGTKQKMDPFRRAVLRGLGILLPPLLTIVIFLWIGNTVTDRLLVPLENLARWALVDTADIRSDSSLDPKLELVRIDGQMYRKVATGKFIPSNVYQQVEEMVGTESMPNNAKQIYTIYINETYLRREYVIPVFLCLFVLLLYLLGKFMAAGVGSFFWHRFELLIHRLPIVRNVYSSVKQVTDFLFTDRDLEYTRVVAVEYPRKGIWTLGFVTGESLLDIRGAANEPVLSILIPTSPMPFTGFTMTVKRSETIDLNITIDQAFQFVISCGVVVPPQQLAEALEAKSQKSAPISARVDPPSTLTTPALK